MVEQAGRTIDDIDWVIAHQTGVEHHHRAWPSRSGIDPDRFLMTLDHTGNTSGATIPIALDHFNRQGRLTDGDFIVMPTVGAGMAWGATCFDWVETPAGRQAKVARADGTRHRPHRRRRPRRRGAGPMTLLVLSLLAIGSVTAVLIWRD